MTLAKAVEALKEAVDWMHMKKKSFPLEKAEKALASLPEPKTEDEIAMIIYKCHPMIGERGAEVTRKIIRALRDAGCLYVMEGE